MNESRGLTRAEAADVWAMVQRRCGPKTIKTLPAATPPLRRPDPHARRVILQAIVEVAGHVSELEDAFDREREPA